MKLNANFKLVMNIPATVARFDPRYKRAQQYLDNEVLKDSEEYVPMRTGNLVRSGQRGTNIGSGEVVYNAPYAQDVYHGMNRKFRKDLHPKACAQWFEKAKGVNMPKWEKGVNSQVKG